MIEKQITNTNADVALRRLYETAFPEEEQIPWGDLMRLVEVMPLDFTAYYDDETLMGFTVVYPRSSFNWFWYFAVPKQLRGKGVGQKILTQLIEKYKDSTNILDMEAWLSHTCSGLCAITATPSTSATASATLVWVAHSRESTTPS